MPWVAILIGGAALVAFEEARRVSGNLKPWAPVAAIGLGVWAYSIYKRG